MPLLLSWQKQLAGRRGVDLLFLSVDERERDLTRFLSENPDVAPGTRYVLLVRGSRPWLAGFPGAPTDSIHCRSSRRGGAVRCIVPARAGCRLPDRKSPNPALMSSTPVAARRPRPLHASARQEPQNEATRRQSRPCRSCGTRDRLVAERTSYAALSASVSVSEAFRAVSEVARQSLVSSKSDTTATSGERRCLGERPLVGRPGFRPRTSGCCRRPGLTWST